MENMRVIFYKILILSLWVSQVLAMTEVSSGSTGPVSVVMEDLAYNTAAITDEIYLQLNTKMQRTTDSLLGNIEVIIASAMDQLSTPIFQANQKLASGNCQEVLSMDELRKRINAQLSNCTQDLNDILAAFQDDADVIANTLQSFVSDIVNLPVACRLLTASSSSFVEETASFASSSSCFVEKIADINQHVSRELNRASMTLVRTRQLAKSSVADAELCTSAVVAEVVNHLDKSFENC